ncbi:MAG: DUF368 domain-containing protein [Clostridia bacterium]
MKNIVLCAKGFLMGLANLIPGISGGTLAITLGIYEKFISALGNFFADFKENLKFLIPIGVGIVLSLLTLSRVISFGLENFVFATIMLFVGAIFGGLPMLCGRMKGEKVSISHILAFVIACALVLTTVFLSAGADVSFENMGAFDYVKMFFVGVVSAFTMLIPGVSGSAVLMTIGYYTPTIDLIKNLTDTSLIVHNFLILLPFGLGIVAGMLGGAKFIETLIKKNPVKSYWAIVGFVVASIIGIVYQNFIVDGVFISVGLLEIVVGIVFFVGAFLLAYKFGTEK